MGNWLKRARVKWWLIIVKHKLKRGNYTEALEILQKVITVQSNRALALVQAGWCLANLNRSHEALAFYERALQIVPNYGDAHAYLSLTYSDLGRKREAVESLNRAVRIMPSLMKHEFWVRKLAHMCADTENWEESLAAFTKLTELDKRDGNAWHGVGWANEFLDRDSEAASAYERAAKLMPENAVIQSNLGAIYVRLERPKEAIEHLQRSKALQPSLNARTHLNLGYGYCGLGNFDKALPSVLEALKLDPHVEGGYELLASAYAGLRRFQDAVEAINAGIQLDPNDGELFAALANYRIELDEMAEALDSAKEAIRLHPDSASAHFSMGRALQEQDKHDEAIAAYNRASELSPNRFEPYSNLGLIYVEQGREQDALCAFLTAVGFEPHDPKVHFELGKLYIRLGKREEALRELQSLRELHNPLADDLAKQMDSDSAHPTPDKSDYR